MDTPLPPELSVVVPVYRNAETLPELMRRLSHVLGGEGISWEVIFVNDACPAGSLPVLKEIARADARVSILSLRSNVGQHRAIFTGLRYAQSAFAVILDADLQDPVDAIPLLLRTAREGYDAVFAGRRGAYESPFRLLTSRMFKTTLHLLCGVPADAGIFVLLSRTMLERLLSHNEKRLFTIAMIGCAGLPMISVPVHRDVRPVGTSAYTPWMRLKIGLLAVLWVVQYKLRIKFFPNHRAGKLYSTIAVIDEYIGSRFQKGAVHAAPIE